VPRVRHSGLPLGSLGRQTSPVPTDDESGRMNWRDKDTTWLPQGLGWRRSCDSSRQRFLHRQTTAAILSIHVGEEDTNTLDIPTIATHTHDLLF